MEKLKNNWLWILLGLIVVSVIIFFVVKKRKKDKFKNSNSDMSGLLSDKNQSTKTKDSSGDKKTQSSTKSKQEETKQEETKERSFLDKAMDYGGYLIPPVAAYKLAGKIKDSNVFDKIFNRN